MFEGLEKVRNLELRRERIEDELDNGYLLSDVLVAEMSVRVQALEIIQGIERDRDNRQVRTGQPREERFRLMTVDGKPLGNVKVGQRTKKISSTKLSEMAMRGESPDIMKEYPSSFEVDGERAVYLMSQYGYGFIEPRFRRRHAANRQEKDSYGNDVVPIDRWRLVEYGSRFARQAAEELVGRAATAEPGDAERLLKRADELYPEYTPGAAMLAARGKRK